MSLVDDLFIHESLSSFLPNKERESENKMRCTQNHLLKNHDSILLPTLSAKAAVDT